MEDAGREGATRDTGKGAALGTLAGPRRGRAQKVRLLAGTAAATAARGKKPGVLSQSVSFPAQGAAAVQT